MQVINKIEYSPYHLKYKNKNKQRDGALLRVHFLDSIGYADCHPWPEIGDDSLNEQLSFLKNGKALSTLLKNSVQFAQWDAIARKEKRHLLSELTLPKSHFLITDIFDLSEGLLNTLIERGFTHIKVKLGNDLNLEEKILKNFSHYPFKWRFDFNSKISSGEFLKFINKLNCLSIDLCEDPFPFNRLEWKKITDERHVLLAIDKNVSQHKNENFVLVIKPAIDPLNILKKNSVKNKFYVTSYLDHPLGQTCSAYISGLLFHKFPNEMLLCGLLSHEAYEESIYSEEIKTFSNCFRKPSGTGFGFDALLENEKWKEL